MNTLIAGHFAHGMAPVVLWGDVAWWVAGLALAWGLLCGLAVYLPKVCRGLLYKHRQGVARVKRANRIDRAMAIHNQYEAERATWHDPACERIGRHRAPWNGPLDDQPAPVIAEVTDAARRRNA